MNSSYSAPEARNTAGIVFVRILRSNHSDHRSIYSISSFIHFSKGVSDLPFTISGDSSPLRVKVRSSICGQFKRDVGSTVDLPEAGHAGTNTKAPTVPVLAKTLIVSKWQRSGADEAHVSLEHIDQLRQFVDAGSSQKPTNRCDPRIIPYFEYGPAHIVQVF